MGLWRRNLHPAADGTSSAIWTSNARPPLIISGTFLTNKTCCVTEELWFIAFSWEVCLRCRLLNKLRARWCYWSCTETSGLLLCIRKWSSAGAINYYRHPWKSSLQRQSNPGRGSCRDPQEKLSCDCAECSTLFIFSKIITLISQKAKQITAPPPHPPLHNPPDRSQSRHSICHF